MTEFELIYKLINTQAVKREDVLTGIGDDCAIVSVPDGYSLAVTMDTLVEGVHFPVTASAYSIGYKSLAVNLSDLAATGANPAWVTLSLTMPSADEIWIREFVRGLFELANRYNVQLIGGDTCSGPLSISIQAHGFVKRPLLRSGAQLNDSIYVSGYLGDSALGFRSYNGEDDITLSCQKKFNQPDPRIELGLWLSQYATSCIDISDGLHSDLDHICKKSRCGADVFLHKIPLSDDYIQYFNQQPDYTSALSFGDDYELCFTIHESHREEVAVFSKQTGLALSCIGHITSSDSIKIFDQKNNLINIGNKGFDHFK